MLRLHLNCVQFYDWMYTHYDYVPPQDRFANVLGKVLDFGAVRWRIGHCRQRGMAPMAYASVYGAEMSLAQAHPDWLLYDGTGRPMSLGNVFFIQDLSPDCGWRRQLLTAYQQALDLGFAGLQCDTYGSPRAGLTHDGREVSLGAALPGLMAKAQALAAAADPVMGGAIVNCVRAWPLDIMAKAPGAAHYVEVWDPDETYRDLHELGMRARRLDPGRQLVLAAYLPAFHREAGPPVGAMAGLRLAAAAIFAAGGFHLLMGEGSGVLADPYFPLYGCARRGGTARNPRRRSYRA